MTVLTPTLTEYEATNRPACRYLAFVIDTEAFAVPIILVREILDSKLVVRSLYPGQDDVGVLNYKGKIISVLDYRRVLGMASLPRSEYSMVIILEKPSENGTMVGACLVDHVVSIVKIDETIEKSSAFLNTARPRSANPWCRQVEAAILPIPWELLVSRRNR